MRGFLKGGNLGLFSGMSIMVLFELAQLVSFTVCGVKLPEEGETQDMKFSKMAIFRKYLESSTLHGLQYLVLMRLVA